MKLIIIREIDDYVICKESKDYRMMLAKRCTSWKNGRQLDITNKKGELLLRTNKKKRKWFGPELEVFYTVKVGSNRVYEVRRKDYWEMSDANTTYRFQINDAHRQLIFRDHLQVASVNWESTFTDEDIIHVEMDDKDELLQIIGFLLIFTMESKRNSKHGNIPINMLSGLQTK
jgi:hypothetical protein